MKNNTRKIMLLITVLFPGFTAAFIIGSIFGINSILDGYGDLKLLIYYFIAFCLVFAVLTFILYLYSIAKKIPITLFNFSYLLCTMVISFMFFYLSIYTTKIFLETKIKKEIIIFHSFGFLFIFLSIFAIGFLLFILLSSSYKKVKGHFLAILITCLIAPWLFVLLSAGTFKKISLQQGGPNILLLTVECLRYDYLGCNGNRQIMTPNIDALAKKGIVFDNYFVQAPYTHASLCSILTGRYPFKHGARYFGQKSDPQYKPFVEELANKGYFVKIDNSAISTLFPDNADFNQRFYREVKFSLPKAIYHGLSYFQYITNDYLGNLMPLFFGQYCFGDTTSMRQTSKLLHCIRSNRNKRWFFWTHFDANCHVPFSAPENFLDLYNKDNRYIKTSYSNKDLFYLGTHPEAITDNILEGLKIAYSAEVSCIDRQIGMVIDYLKKLNLLEKTLVIITADHGEMLGEGNFIGHSKFLKDTVIHVPLIIYSADYFSGGRRINDFAEEVGIAPTILDICAIDTNQKFDGTSLLDAFKPNQWHKNSIYSETPYAKTQGERSFIACCRTKEYKLIWNAKENVLVLYDLINDPDEKEDLKNRLPEVVTKMYRQLLDLTGLTSLDKLIPPFDNKIDQETINRLRALGYIQ